MTYVETRSEAGAAPPLEKLAGAAPAVYVHCSGGAARQWRGLWALLPGIEHRGFNLIGHGGNAPRRAGETAGIAADSRAIDRIGPVGRRFHLVGHSYGGAVALRYALAHPERLLSLTLIEPSNFAVLAHGDRADREALMEIRSLAAFVENAVRKGAPERGMDVFVDYWGGAGCWSQLSLAKRERLASMGRVISDHFAQLLGDLTPLQKIACVSVPTLILCGTHSRRPSRAVSRILASVIDTAIHRSLSGADHMAAIIEPMSIAAAMRDFMRSRLL